MEDDCLEIGETRKAFGKTTPLGARRTTFAEAADVDMEAVAQAMIEREPVTVVVSVKGWVRALKGHVADTSTLTFKDGDALRFALHAETTDRLLWLATNGRVYTLPADRLPGGRGHGEPFRIMVDMENNADIVSVFVHGAKRKRLLVSTLGNGFVVAESDLVANTRKGKQVLNVSAPSEALLCITLGEGATHLATVGENRKMLIFPLDQVPAMGRGKGVRLQKYKDGGIVDARPFALADGLTWTDSAGRIHTRNVDELREFVGERAQAGRMVPKGFPKSGKFSG